MEKKGNNIKVYYRSCMDAGDVYSFWVPRKFFDDFYTRVYLSNYRINKCERECGLCYGDCIDFSLSPVFLLADRLDVYRSANDRRYRCCLG